MSVCVLTNEVADFLYFESCLWKPPNVQSELLRVNRNPDWELRDHMSLRVSLLFSFSYWN